MRYFGNKFSKELERAAGKAAGQPETLVMCLNEFMEKSPESEIGIKRYQKGAPMNSGTITVRDMHAMIPGIDDFIRDQYGGGRFRLEFYNADQKVLANYNLSIDGPEKRYSTKSAGNGDAASVAGKKDMQQTILEMYQAQNTALMGLFSQGKNSEFNDFMKEYLLNQMNNSLTREENALNSASGILSLVQQARPEIPPEDGNVALIQAIGAAVPAFLQYMASRSSPQPPLSAYTRGQKAVSDVLPQSLPEGLEALAGATPESINAVLQTLTPEQIAQLTGKKPPNPVNTSPDTVELPAPGEQQRAEAEPSTSGSGVQPPHLSEMPLEHVTFEVKIAQLRSDAEKGAEPGVIADEIIALIEASRLLTPDNPHPMLKELTQEDDLNKLAAAMVRFFQQIPKLAAEPELQEKVGRELYERITEEFTQEQPEQGEAGDQPDELLSTAPGVQEDDTDAGGHDSAGTGEHGGIDQREPGRVDGEGIDKPGPVPVSENVQSAVA